MSEFREMRRKRQQLAEEESIAIIYPLICQPFIARSQIDNPAIGETVLDDVVLHDSVVPMGVPIIAIRQKNSLFIIRIVFCE